MTINQLYKFTDMQVTFGCNMLALDKGMPRTMNIKHMISAWIEHRIEVIRRRTRFELAKAESRAHLLEGYLKALDHLDAVVRLIRESDNKEIAKTELMAHYALSERQANAVLELRLYQLTGLERGKIEDEYKDLQQKSRISVLFWLANFLSAASSKKSSKSSASTIKASEEQNHRRRRRVPNGRPHSK